MIGIRVDGNKNIGIGHVMRCLSFAKMFSSKKDECIFIMSDDNCASILDKNQYPYIILNSDYQNLMDGIDTLIEIIKEKNINKMIVDSYSVTNEFFERINSYSETMYIDDYCKDAFEVNELLNYNIYASREEYEKLYHSHGIKVPNLLLGRKYVPLRDEFKNASKIKINDDIKDILVMTGGSDEYHIALSMLKYITEQKIDDYHWHFIIGPYNTDKNEIEKMQKLDEKIHIYSNPSHISEIMKKVDVAISAGGSTLYELSELGIPTLVYTIADNQIRAAKTFNDLGIMVYVGDFREKQESLIEKIVLTIRSLKKDLRQMMIKKYINSY